MRVNFAFFTSGEHPVAVGIRGNPNYQSEHLLDVEAGYRLQLGTTASLDLTAFHGRYSNLATIEPLPPTFETTPLPAHIVIGSQLNNLLRADTSGVEVSGHLTLASFWRMDASYSGFRLTPTVDPTSLDPAAAQFDGNTPAHQWQLHSAVWLGQRSQLDVSWFHVGALRVDEVPAYDRADARFEVKLTDALSAIATGRNLLAPWHVEFNGLGSNVVPTRVPRSADLQLVWRIR
jgi:outer membrane receptor protein involved in Fe transport